MKKTISQLSKAQQEKTRQQWRDYQKKHREGTRTLDKIMNFTPESMNSSAADDPVDLPVEAQPNPPDQEYANMFVQDGKQPQASSTPEKEIRVKKRFLRILQKEKAYLRKEMLKLKRQLAATKQTSEKLRKSLERLKKGKKTVSERNNPRGTKKLALERKEEVVKFLCRDENSRLLPGKKDTITKNRNKQQR